MVPLPSSHHFELGSFFVTYYFPKYWQEEVAQSVSHRADFSTVCLKTEPMIMSHFCSTLHNPLICPPPLCPLPPTQGHLQQQLARWSKFRQRAKTNNPRWCLALFFQAAQLLSVFFGLPCKCMWIKAGLIGRRLCGASSQNQQQLLQCPGASIGLPLFVGETKKNHDQVFFLQPRPPDTLPSSLALLDSLLNPMTRLIWRAEDCEMCWNSAFAF